MGIENQYIQKVRQMDEDAKADLIASFEHVANTAWNYDTNASIIGRDFEIDLGGRTKYHEDRDKVKTTVIRKAISTFRLMIHYSFGYQMN